MKMANEITKIHMALTTLCEKINELYTDSEVRVIDERQGVIEDDECVSITVEFGTNSYLEDSGATCRDSWEVEYNIIGHIKNVRNYQQSYELMEAMTEVLQDPPRGENGLPEFVTWGRIGSFNISDSPGIDALNVTGCNVVCSYRISYLVHRM